MAPLYAPRGTPMVEGRGSNPSALDYRVVWLDPSGHVHTTSWNLIWGEARILADKLDHGEPYYPPH